MTKLFSIWGKEIGGDGLVMAVGPITSENALLVGMCPEKPLGELAHEEMTKATVQRAFHGTETFWIRRDR